MKYPQQFVRALKHGNHQQAPVTLLHQSLFAADVIYCTVETLAVGDIFHRNCHTLQQSSTTLQVGIWTGKMSYVTQISIEAHKTLLTVAG
jgi:hypothetical protein